MARFEFKMEPLLTHRRRLEDERQRALAVLLREKLILETQLRNQQQSISEDKQRLSGALAGRVDVDSIRRHAAHNHRLAVRAQQIAIRLFELTRQIEAARVALVEATKQRKAIELLRDKRFDRWRKRQQRKATAELDELATQKYGRKRREVAA